ncbi:MAG TPA: DNA polymerase I [Ktedonobacteraceae bacterium]|nr:DNA polymerase I [Ktedonobacteraceae bacterium]
MTEIVTQNSTTTHKKLIIIDGHAMIHRAYHAVPETLATKKGEIINAIFGFTSLLIKALNEIKPDYIAMTFDRPVPTFRHQQFAPYKAHRPTMPENMRPQFGRIREVVEAFGIPIYEKDGFEADDVLGTLSRQATKLGVETIILTGDMDTLQLVDEHVRVMAAKKGITEVTEYGIEEVKQRFGVSPEHVPDYKGLVGDTSDNIPGVKGVGEKTAKKLLETYDGDIEKIFAHIDDLGPKEQRLLRGKEEEARQSKFLATIVCDVPVQLDLEACRVGQVNHERTLALFRELEFRTLIDKIPGVNTVREDGQERKAKAPPVEEQDEDLLTAPPLGVVQIMDPPAPPDVNEVDMLVDEAAREKHTPQQAARVRNETGEEKAQDGPLQLSLFAEPEPAAEVVHRLRLPALGQGAPVETPLLFMDKEDPKKTSTMIVNTPESLRVLISSMKKAGAFAMDTESTSEDAWQAELVGLSFAMAPGEGYYIPVGHTTTMDGQEAGAQLPKSEVLEALRPVLEDPHLQKYMHNAKYDMLLLARQKINVRGLAFDSMIAAYLTDPGRRGLGLKDQVFARLGHLMTPISELIGTGSKAITMDRVPVRLAADYAGADADMTLRLVAPLKEELTKHHLLNLYHRIELPLVPVLLQMEIHGVALDGDFLRELGGRLSEQLKALEKEIYASVGREFNVNSTKQLGDILFTDLKLPSGKKTKTGYSVSADVLEGLRGKHPMVDHLLEYRQLAKLKSTYVDGLLTLMNPVTGRVHTSFNQTIASSGRLSSSNPNLQNIPVRTEVGRQIRRGFIADPSYTLLTADYSQFELRILAHITHEPRLVEAFTKNEDIHTITAASLFNVPPEAVNKDQRRLAKTVVYAVLYGQSAFGLAQITGMTNSEAGEFIKRYHETFPQIKGYVESTLTQARKQGYVNTLYGRKRFFPEMSMLSHNERLALEREAINMPIQGGNADLIKIAMLRVQHRLTEKQLKTRMILQVHDELVFEVPTEELDLAKYYVKNIMEGVAHLDVPIKVELKVGKNWFEAEPAE